MESDILSSPLRRDVMEEDIHTNREMCTSNPVATTKPPPCVYLKGGVCVQHGPGAKRKWKPGNKKETIMLVGGGTKTVSKREYYWKCDVGPGGKKSIQTRIFPVKTTPRGRGVGRDDTGRGADVSSLNFNSDAYSGAGGEMNC